RLLLCISLLFLYYFYCLFFFSSRRRHTRSKRDWSSDVCSSDLTMAILIPTPVAIPILAIPVTLAVRLIQMVERLVATPIPTLAAQRPMVVQQRIVHQVIPNNKK